MALKIEGTNPFHPVYDKLYVQNILTGMQVVYRQHFTAKNVWCINHRVINISIYEAILGSNAFTLKHPKH